MQMAIPLYLTTIEQDIFDTFRYLPHAVAVGVGFVTVAAAWKNQQMIKKQKRLEHAHSVPGTQLLLWFLVAVYFAMMLSITLFSREPGSRTGVDVKLFETWGNQRLPDRYLWKIFCCFSRSAYCCRRRFRLFGKDGAASMRRFPQA